MQQNRELIDRHSRGHGRIADARGKRVRPPLAERELHAWVRGQDGHAARPHRAIDPIMIGAHIILALQSLVARRADPLDSAVLSICQFHAGTVGNVIPDEATLNGTLRTFKAEAMERAALAGAKLLGERGVIHERLPAMGAEDFAYMAQKVPGCFVRLGQAGGARGSQPVHTVTYDFNDDILPIGASPWSTLVEQELPRT